MNEATIKTETISYRELARRIGDCVLNNTIQSELAGEYDFKLFTGEDSYCYKHETPEECKADDYTHCDHEYLDIYQTYIITQNSAEYLRDYTSEIVHHCDKLDLYLWGVTHYGTSWDGVYLTMKTV